MSLGGGGRQVSTSTTVKELSPEQQQLLKLVLPEARRFVEKPPQVFPGSVIAPFDPLQEAGQRAAVGAATGFIPGVLDRAAQTQQFLAGPVLFPESNPALARATAAATRPILEGLVERALPAVRQEAITSGQFGGSRQGIAEGLATREALRAVGDTAAGLQTQAFQSGLDALTKSLFAAPTIASLGTLPAQILEGVGSQRQALEQARLSEEAQRFAAEQLVPFAAAQDVASLAFGIGGGSSSTTATVPGAQVSPVQTALGFASLGATLGPTLGLTAATGGGVGAALGLLAGLL